MSSMIQQFYINKTFKYSIMYAEDNKPLKPATGRKNEPISDDNILHQLQRIFGYLDLSDRQDFNPLELCFSYKDYSQSPVNVMIQQDAYEFINLFFAQLENGLKDTPFKSIIDSIYGGTYMTTFECGECKKKKSREENFSCVELEVKNQKTLQASFENFTKEEMIQDYLCENCDKKVDMTKKSMLRKLPNILLIHLQRIIFDLDLLQNMKIISKNEFSETFDISPYTYEDTNNSLNSEPIIYNLKGIVVHQGSADVGHYYSFIKIQKKKWLEFNDSVIKEFVFDLKEVEKECFGGESLVNNDDNWVGASDVGPKQSKSAYILVYEKAIKDEIVVEFENQEIAEQVLELSLIHI
eukprot:TRINITY_DN9313_c0_g1_i4.p3 TRINITY_DN9313_c0_g1~~TRINITY_DN9313_c0_g1_i4.p3  ORF type:complete len:353 (-),score=60.67 TRINITY_DN9313_c0_g1_i4:149-1207(-)